MVTMEFAVVKSHSPYNVLLGRTDLRSLEAAASTIHLMIKFHTNNEIATMTTKRETLQEYRRIEEAQGLVSDIQQKDKKQRKTNKTKHDKMERSTTKSKPKAVYIFKGPTAEPILDRCQIPSNDLAKQNVTKELLNGPSAKEAQRSLTHGMPRWQSMCSSNQSNGHNMDPMIGKDSRDEINLRGACKEIIDHSSQAYK
ncbi:hypothetical protein Tco_0955936 [Tanacetum coccineum]|uniref:Uncharacterized protein n=1 Tax=Tanacetum coccineum TaxID=301880 RepID=A0ABQ5E8J8_9ASTR